MPRTKEGRRSIFFFLPPNGERRRRGKGAWDKALAFPASLALSWAGRDLQPPKSFHWRSPRRTEEEEEGGPPLPLFMARGGVRGLMSHCGVAGEEGGGGGRRGGCGKGERVQSLGGVLWGKAAFFWTDGRWL